MALSLALKLPLPRAVVFTLLTDPDRLFRLNPQWAVLSHSATAHLRQGSTFALNVRYDRTDEEMTYACAVAEFVENERLVIALDASAPRSMAFTVSDAEGGAVLGYEEGGREDLPDAEKRELALWLRSIGNYLVVSSRTSLRARLWKWAVDRVWLKLTPSGRRIAFFIIVAEVLSFVFLILLLLWLVVFKKF